MLADFFRDVKGSFSELSIMRERSAPLDGIISKNKGLAVRIIAFFEKARDEYMGTGRTGSLFDSPLKVMGEVITINNDQTCAYYRSVLVERAGEFVAYAALVNGDNYPEFELNGTDLRVQVYSPKEKYSFRIYKGEEGYGLSEMVRESGYGGAENSPMDESPMFEKRKFVFNDVSE